MARTWRPETSGASYAVTGDLGSARELRFEVRAGDRALWDAAHNHPAERSEVSDFAQKEPTDTDIWFAFKMTVEPGAPVTSRWLVLGQLHATEDPGDNPGSPPWAQELDAGDRFRIVIRTSGETPLRRNPTETMLFADPSFERGRTYRFVYQLRYSQSAGRLRAWRDGQLVADYAGPLGYANRRGPYFKFGIYREPAPETIAVRYTDLQFGGQALRP